MSALRRTLAATTAASLAFAGIALTAAPASAAPTVPLVDVLTDNAADGFTLREAIAAAQANPGPDEIGFTPGLTGTLAIDSPLFANEALTIIGPGSGNLTLTRSAAMANGSFFQFFPATADQDFAIQGMTLQGDDVKFSSAVVFANGAASVRNATVTDVVIADMRVNTDGGGIWATDLTGTLRVVDSTVRSVGDADNGGGIYADDTANVVFENVSLTDNVVGGLGGGAVVFDAESFAMSGGLVTENTSTNSDGGGIALIDVVTASIDGVTFEDNGAANPGGVARGGAVYLERVGLIDIADSVFALNSADFGGAVGADEDSDTTLSIANSSFSSNDALDGNGGAVYLDESSGLTIADSRFAANEAVEDGGAIYVAEIGAGLANIARTTFEANAADGFGGAVYVDAVVAPAEFSIDSSTFFANQAGEEGVSLAIQFVVAPVTVVNSTFDENADDDGFVIRASAVSGVAFDVAHSTIVGPGGVGINAFDEEGSASLTHSIVASTTDDETVAVFNEDQTIPVAWSILSDSPATVDAGPGVQANTAAQLAALADNGGPTLTRMPASASPAVNMGDPAVAGAPTVDQRGTGYARILAGRIDIGAVERPSELAATGAESSTGVALLAGLALLAGVGILAVRRRRDVVAA